MWLTASAPLVSQELTAALEKERKLRDEARSEMDKWKQRYEAVERKSAYTIKRLKYVAVWLLCSVTHHRTDRSRAEPRRRWVPRCTGRHSGERSACCVRSGQAVAAVIACADATRTGREAVCGRKTAAACHLTRWRATASRRLGLSRAWTLSTRACRRVLRPGVASLPWRGGGRGD